MQLISSYTQLNQKYDLNFSDNNYGFSWDVFKEFVGEQWAEFFTTNCFYRFVPTARLTRKTWNYYGRRKRNFKWKTINPTLWTFKIINVS
ncbi:hypothetical protein [Spiroplasma sp. AdecLV25b]|uniref:hypothetical protein n=1 Tax=Spiroplasma sp. AdecLV25b TaxID=3027162 RepID=UPI0027E0F43A|nr:hypothetical protein [Spiroplasma sp. AdecLV25b]